MLWNLWNRLNRQLHWNLWNRLNRQLHWNLWNRLLSRLNRQLQSNLKSLPARSPIHQRRTAEAIKGPTSQVLHQSVLRSSYLPRPQNLQNQNPRLLFLPKSPTRQVRTTAPMKAAAKKILAPVKAAAKKSLALMEAAAKSLVRTIAAVKMRRRRALMIVQRLLPANKNVRVLLPQCHPRC